MRILATITLFTAASVASAAPAPADAPPASVIKAAIKATGGEEAINKFKGSSATMKGEITFGDNDLDFEGKMICMVPDKFKLTVKTAFAGMKIEVVQVLNGKKIKSVTNGQETQNKDNVMRQLEANMIEYEALQLTPLLDAKKFTMKVAEDADVEGKKAEVIVVNSTIEGTSFKDLKLFFDKSSHLLVKTQRKDTDESGKEVDEENFYSDYKKVQDIMTPHKVKTKHDGKDYMNYSTSDVKYFEKVDEKEFAVDD